MNDVTAAMVSNLRQPKSSTKVKISTSKENSCISYVSITIHYPLPSLYLFNSVSIYAPGLVRDRHGFLGGKRRLFRHGQYVKTGDHLKKIQGTQNATCCKACVLEMVKRQSAAIRWVLSPTIVVVV